MEFLIRPIGREDRGKVSRLLEKCWGDSLMIVHGETFDMSTLPGYLAVQDDCISGIITYRESEGMMEIISLDSFSENQGIGTVLLKTVIRLAENKHAVRLFLTTTNDNLRALAFYQKRDFTITGLRIGAVSQARKKKPLIPLRSPEGIPIEHELELDYRFKENI